MKFVVLEEHLSDNVSWLEWYLRSSWESLYNNQCSLSARRTFATDGERKETQAVLGGEYTGLDPLISTLRDLNGWRCPDESLHFSFSLRAWYFILHAF